jgi:hypothetical protein
MAQVDDAPSTGAANDRCVTRRFVYTTVGLAAAFSGLAMLTYILTPISVIAAEVGFAMVAVMVLVLLVRRAPEPLRREVARSARAGIAAGAVATLAYDASRTVLSLFDPLPYMPFEAIRQFGLGVLPAGSDPGLVLGVGFVVHMVNGCSFGVIYAMFARDRLATARSALASGMVWGVVLELVQSILYPGWLGITTTLKEFLVISGAGHLVYGATLGIGVRGLLRAGRPAALGPGPSSRAIG